MIYYFLSLWVGREVHFYEQEARHLGFSASGLDGVDRFNGWVVGFRFRVSVFGKAPTKRRAQYSLGCCRGCSIGPRGLSASCATRSELRGGYCITGVGSW